MIRLQHLLLCLFIYCVDYTAELRLKKKTTEDKTFKLPITIKDNAGMGVTHLFTGEFISSSYHHKH